LNSQDAKIAGNEDKANRESAKTRKKCSPPTAHFFALSGFRD